MTLSESLLTAADAYCEARGISRPTLAGLALRDSRVLDRLADGGSITIRNFERCMRWLSEHWPEGVEWPAGVERPTANQEAAD